MDFTVYSCLACFFFIPLVLQGVGFFTPNWISNESCTRIGLFYSCCEKGTGGCQILNADAYISKLALPLQATSLAINLLTVFYMVRVLCYSGDDDDRGRGRGCLCCVFAFMLYPLSGVLNIVACAELRKHTSSLGYSYNLAVAAGFFTIWQVILMCYCAYKRGCNDDNGYESRYAARPESHQMAVSATTSSGQSVSPGGNNVVGQIITREESGESGGIAFARIQIVRIMRNSHIID